MRQAIFVLALAAALVACSEDPMPPAAPPPPGCDLGFVFVVGTCYSEPTATPTTCSADSGSWLPAGCPRGSDLVGMCIDATGRTTYKYSTDFTMYATNDAAASCTGTFLPMGAQTSASCDLRPIPPMCADGTGTQSDVEQGAFWCSLAGGTVIAGPCPSTGRSGTCSYNSGSGIDVQERWYDGTTAVQAGCTNPGDVWTPG